MARDGSGNFSRIVTPPNTGDIASATDFNSEMNDIATALSDSINKAGTKAFAANQPFGGFKATGLGAATTAGDAVRYEQVLPSVFQTLDATLTALAALSWASGTPIVQFTAADTLSLTLTPSVTSMTLGTGSAGAPSLTFTGDSNTGLANTIADTVDFVTGGTIQWRVNSGGALASPAAKGVLIGPGSVTSPSCAFNADQDNGIYYIGANNWALAAAGVKVLDITATALTVPTTIDLQRATDVTTPVAASVGYIGTILVAKDANYTIAANIAGQTLYHTSASAHTYTIDSNANLALPIGFMFKIRNDNGGGVVTVAITTDTLRWNASTGSRSLAANGSMTLTKQTATSWFAEGVGIT